MKTKQYHCGSCHLKTITLHKKIQATDLSKTYACSNCGSKNIIKRRWYYLTHILHTIWFEALLYGVVTLGITLIFIPIVWIILWPLRLLLTLNQPLKLVISMKYDS